MPEQLKRLLPLFVIFISLFILVRHFLVPDSFGEYGYYRGDALIDHENKEIVYSTTESCIECHPDIMEIMEMDLHSELSCLVCHGPGLQHSLNPESVGIEKPSGREFCGLCHSINPARSTNMVFQVDIREHHPERNDCIDCHNPHAVWEIKE